MKRFLLILLALMTMMLVACQDDVPQASEQAPTGTSAGENAAVNVVERTDVQVLTGISITGADGAKTREYHWELLERRLMTSMTVKGDAAEYSVQFVYHEEENTVTAIGLASGVTVTFQWDDEGRVLSVLEKSSGGSYSLTYTYDNAGRCVERTAARDEIPASRTVYTYDDSGRLLTEHTFLSDGTQTGKRSCEYNQQGDLIRETSQWMDQDATVKEYAYSYGENGLPTVRITVDAELSRSSRTEYTYDEDGNLTQEKRYTDLVEPAETVEYTYDMVRMSETEQELYRMLLAYSRNW